MVEKLCAPYYAETMGRPGVPPGVFFRMLFVGYFEGLKSHRAISWRCIDSRSLSEFLRLAPTDPVPNHSCVSKTHKRLPKEVFDEVFRFILSVAAHKGLVPDSTAVRALSFLDRCIREVSDRDISCDYCGYTHALRAMLLWRANVRDGRPGPSLGR